jgi:hypothetical protein
MQTEKEKLLLATVSLLNKQNQLLEDKKYFTAFVKSYFVDEKILQEKFPKWNRKGFARVRIRVIDKDAQAINRLILRKIVELSAL